MKRSGLVRPQTLAGNVLMLKPFHAFVIVVALQCSLALAQDKSAIPSSSVTQNVGAQTAIPAAGAPNFLVTSSKLTIKTTVITNDLNVKAVPKLGLSIEGDSGTPIQLSSSIEGIAIVNLAPGKYRVKSTRGIDFESKHFDWDVKVDLNAGENQLELSSDNAKITVSEKPNRVTDELSAQYKRLQNSVVTVWSEFGHGTGFIVDPSGLILTNQHVLGPTDYIAVQFDNVTKIPAVKLLADPERDVAVVWADISAFPYAIVAPMALDSSKEPAAIEGERVFAIGSPLNQRKIITTGIVSKIEPHAIISDVRIDHGNSGGPLFNSLGQVIGITTFGEQGRGGGGVSGIVRVEEATKLLEDAKAKMPMVSKPAAALLPVEPETPFPIDAIKETLLREKFDTKHYTFGMGDFEIVMITPPLRYRMEGESEIKATKEKEKRTRKSQQAVQGTFRPLDNLKNWAEYIGEYQPVLLIRATPKIHETGGSIVRRSLIAGLSQGGYGGPATIRFKTDFYRMRLKCGEKEVEPIQPGKIAHMLDVHNYFVNATDATYEGFYTYPPDSISPSCGHVTLEMYSEKKPESAETKVLDEKTVAKVWEDFGPYREALVPPTPKR
jgi:S1-C subfamily serine protease